MSRDLSFIQPQAKPTGGGLTPQGASGLSSVGSGLSSIASGFATLQAARAQSRQLKTQIMFDELRAENQKLKAQENGIALRKQFFSNISSGKSSLAARNVSRGSGIGRRFVVENLRVLQEDLRKNELNSQAIQNQIQLDISQTRLASKTARNLGIMRAGPQFGKAGQSLLTGFGVAG